MTARYTELIYSVRQAWGTATLKDTAVVFSGNLLSSILGAIFFFMLAHQGGAIVFGIFSVVIAVATTVADLFDIAINNAIVNFSGDRRAIGLALRYGLRQKLILSAIAASGLWIFAPLVTQLLGQPELVTSLRYAIWLIPIKSIYSFIKTGLQVATQFYLDSAVEVVSSILRLVIYYLLAAGRVGALESALFSYVGSLVLGSLVALPSIHSLLESDVGSLDEKEFTRFQGWMTMSFMASAVSTRLDVFFLARFTTLSIVGWYQAAMRLFMPVMQLASALSRVFAPRFSNFSTRVDAKSYLHKTLLLSGGLAACLVLSIPLFGFAIPILYGTEFIPSVSLAYQLLPYYMLFLLSTPWWTALLYYHKEARGFALISGVQLLLLAISLPIAISALGVTGVAIALFLALAVTTAAVVKFQIV